MEASRPLQGSRRDHARDLTRGLRLGLCALSLALLAAAVLPAGAGAGAAAAAGVVVTLPGGRTATIPGSALEVGAKGKLERCALRARPGEEPGPSDHRGLPVAEALRDAEVPLPFGYLTVPRTNGTLAYLPGEWFEDELEERTTPFEGCAHALFSVDNGLVRFFRPPLRGHPEDANAEDNISTTAAGEALTVGVHEGAILAVTVTPSTTQVAAGSPVQFSASVPGGGASFTWSFGDGGVASGEAVSHAFPGSGTYEVRATASAGESGGESDPVAIVVGDPPTAPEPGATTTPSATRPPAGPPGKGGRGRGGRSGAPTPGGAHKQHPSGVDRQSHDPVPRHPDTPSPNPPRSHPQTSRPSKHRTPATNPSPPFVPAPAPSPDPGAQEPSGGDSPKPPRCCSAESPPEGFPHNPPEQPRRSTPGDHLVEGRLVGDRLGPTATVTEPLAEASAGQGSRSAAGSEGGGIAVPVGALVVVGLFGAGALLELRVGRALR